MKEYTIVPKPETLDWTKIPSLDINTPLFEGEEVFISAKGQICYDENALYVRLSCDEEEIRAEEKNPLGEVCADSCMEFFFCPIEGDKRYFNIECNLTGAIFLGMGENVQTLVRFIPEVPAILPQGKKLEKGWEVTYTIPYSFIRQFFPEFKAEKGLSIRANCYKCGDKTSRPHYFTWNPVPVLPEASYHNPDKFGIMYFG